MESSCFKICMLYVYLGEFPWYFKFFLKSCKDNSNIDFIIFSDNSFSDYTVSDNIRFENITLADINILASSKLGFDVSVENAYKLCDFKPAFGVIFEDYIMNYNYWGVGDIDVILGNIREILTDNILNEYDVFFVRDDYPTGFFQLYKNTFYINNLFRKSHDYKKVFTTNKHYCFDECNFQFVNLYMGQSIFDTPAEIESLMHVIKQEQKENALRVLFNFLAVEGVPGHLTYTESNLSYKNKYIAILYHLISLKKCALFSYPQWDDIPNKYLIGKHSIYKTTFNGYVDYFIKEYIFHYVFKLSRIFRIQFGKFAKINIQINLDSLGLYRSGNIEYEVVFYNNNICLSVENRLIYQLYKCLGYKKLFVCKELNQFVFFEGEHSIKYMILQNIDGVEMRFTKKDRCLL